MQGRHRPDRRRGRAGSATLVVLSVVALVAGAAVGLVRVTVVATAAARADAVADVGALAAAAHGAAAAGEVVRASGADVEGLWWRRDGAVELLVELDGSRARAAATTLAEP